MKRLLNKSSLTLNKRTVTKFTAKKSNREIRNPETTSGYTLTGGY